MNFVEMLAQYGISGEADESLQKWLERYNIKFVENKSKKKRRKKMSEKKTYISFNKAFVRENIKGKDGETFHSVMIPKGVKIDGVDRGYYRFTTKYVNDDKFNENNRLFSFPEGYEIKLTLRQKTEDGSWQPADTVTVTAEKLKEAILQQRKEYIESHKGKETEAPEPDELKGFMVEDSEIPFDEEPEL